MQYLVDIMQDQCAESYRTFVLLGTMRNASPCN